MRRLKLFILGHIALWGRWAEGRLHVAVGIADLSFTDFNKGEEYWRQVLDIEDRLLDLPPIVGHAVRPRLQEVRAVADFMCP